jgi:hypothetical protein
MANTVLQELLSRLARKGKFSTTLQESFCSYAKRQIQNCKNHFVVLKEKVKYIISEHIARIILPSCKMCTILANICKNFYEISTTMLDLLLVPNVQVDKRKIGILKTVVSRDSRQFFRGVRGSAIFVTPQYF